MNDDGVWSVGGAIVIRTSQAVRTMNIMWHNTHTFACTHAIHNRRGHAIYTHTYYTRSYCLLCLLTVLAERLEQYCCCLLGRHTHTHTCTHATLPESAQCTMHNIIYDWCSSCLQTVCSCVWLIVWYIPTMFARLYNVHTPSTNTWNCLYPFSQRVRTSRGSCSVCTLHIPFAIHYSHVCTNT